MKKSKLTVKVKYIGDNSWNLYINGPFKYQALLGVPTRPCAKTLARLFNLVFKAGKLQEFKENTKNAQRLMRKFGL